MTRLRWPRKTCEDKQDGSKHEDKVSITQRMYRSDCGHNLRLRGGANLVFFALSAFVNLHVACTVDPKTEVIPSDSEVWRVFGTAASELKKTIRERSAPAGERGKSGKRQTVRETARRRPFRRHACSPFSLLQLTVNWWQSFCSGVAILGAQTDLLFRESSLQELVFVSVHPFHL